MFKSPFLLSAAILVPLAACGQGPNAPEGTEIVQNGVVMAEDARTAADVADATATGPNTAFGLTASQIDDAEIVSAGGRELAEVEDIITDGNGTITMLVIEVEDTDRDVQLPPSGLRAVRSDDGDWDLQTAMTSEQLLALPAEPASTVR